MGKTDNIRRAKKLKEQKRKRLQEQTTLSGTSNVSASFKSKLESEGNTVIYNKSKVKYSELLDSFVQPLLGPDDTLDSIKTKFIFGAFVWNAAIIRENSEDEFIAAKKHVLSNLTHIPDTESVFDEMVNRKQEEFSEFRHLIIEVDVEKKSGLDYQLNIAVSIPQNF